MPGRPIRFRKRSFRRSCRCVTATSRSACPPDLTGVDGKIADAFNDIAAVSDRRARETARVSRAVGKEGKLKQRMTVPGVVGGWADEVAASTR